MSLATDITTLRTLIEGCLASHHDTQKFIGYYGPDEPTEVTMVELRLSRLYAVARNDDYPEDPQAPEWISRPAEGKGLYSRQTQPKDENGVPVVDGQGNPVYVTEYYDLAFELHRKNRALYKVEQITPGSDLLADYNTWLAAQAAPAALPTS